MLDTARRLFAEHGYDGTSLQMIANAMGVTKANVYYYFRTKASILEAMLEANVAALTEALDAGGGRSRPAGAQGVPGQGVRRPGGGEPGDLTGRPQRPRTAQAGRGQDRAGGPGAAGKATGVRRGPTPDEVAAYSLLGDLGPSMRDLPQLSDDELREVLVRLCLRVLKV
ncbi:MAG: helix-turn-helix domain-containing protein [Umezawaea sp.]